MINQTIGDNVTEYEKRAIDPCWQHKQTCVAMFTIDSHNTSYLYRREDNTYYWQHCRKKAEDEMTKKKEEREYAKSREEYFREFHRVIAPVVVMKKYDE